MAGGKEYGYAFPVTSYPRVHNTYKDGSRSPVFHSLYKSIAGFPYIELGNFMGQVFKLKCPVYLIRHTMHCTYSTICITEV